MKRIIFGAALALVSLAALAQFAPMRVGIFWTAPTAHTDGSALDPVTDLSGYSVLCGTDDGGPYPLETQVDQTGDAPIEAIAKETLIDELGLVFEVVYYCVARAIKTNGRTSANSNQVAFFVEDDRAPGAPVLRIE